MQEIQELAYVEKDDKIVGIKLPSGLNVIKDGNRGYFIEFNKARWKGNFLKQICNNKLSVISFGIEKDEAKWLMRAIEGCDKLG